MLAVHMSRVKLLPHKLPPSSLMGVIILLGQNQLIYIQSCDKEDYLMGELQVPPKTDSRYRKWKTENATVMGWLLDSTKPEISYHYLFLEAPNLTILVPSILSSWLCSQDI